MAFHWRADDGLKLNAGLVLALGFFRGSNEYCLETLYFCDFQRGYGPPVPPSGSVHDTTLNIVHVCKHARIQKMLNSDNVFIVDEEREDPKTTISGP